MMFLAQLVHLRVTCFPSPPHPQPASCLCCSSCHLSSRVQQLTAEEHAPIQPQNLCKFHQTSITMLRNFVSRNQSNFTRNSRPLITSSRFFFNNFNVSNPTNLTVDYLTSSCGLSPESALKASRRLHLKSTTNPDLVLTLFNSYGFTKPQIAKIVAWKPLLLLANPHKSLKPKLEYFTSIGIAGPHLADVIFRSPSILGASLDNTIIPSVNYLKSLVGTDNNGVAVILKKSWWMYHDAERIVGFNIATLRDHGVPQSNISKFIRMKVQCLYKGVDKMKMTVLQLVSMGFCPLSMTFLYGLHVLISINKPKWDEKIAVYRTFGWSEDEVLSVFKKQPGIMRFSVKKIGLVLDFFVNRLKWTREEFAMNPSVISLSLEKRIIPRCHVLQILLSENLISRTSMGSALRVPEYVFLEKYVSKFRTELPDLLMVYQSKMRSQDLQVKAENGCNVLDK